MREGHWIFLGGYLGNGDILGMGVFWESAPQAGRPPGAATPRLREWARASGQGFGPGLRARLWARASGQGFGPGFWPGAGSGFGSGFGLGFGWASYLEPPRRV